MLYQLSYTPIAAPSLDAGRARFKGHDGLQANKVRFQLALPLFRQIDTRACHSPCDRRGGPVGVAFPSDSRFSRSEPGG